MVKHVEDHGSFPPPSQFCDGVEQDGYQSAISSETEGRPEAEERPYIIAAIEGQPEYSTPSRRAYFEHQFRPHQASDGAHPTIDLHWLAGRVLQLQSPDYASVAQDVARIIVTLLDMQASLREGAASRQALKMHTGPQQHQSASYVSSRKVRGSRAKSHRRAQPKFRWHSGLRSLNDAHDGQDERRRKLTLPKPWDNEHIRQRGSLEDRSSRRVT